MGIPGRKPKPTHLKVLEGNPGKRPLPENEPKPAPIMPECPSWLDRYGKAEWKRVAPMLHRLGLLTEADGMALALYCDAYSTYRRAREALKDGLTFTTPNGYVQQKPEVSIANNAMKQIRAFCAEFGMTPSSRGRITVPGLDDDDDWEGLLD
ncbi:phage terminase small subunit P27 family [Symbiobacterium thermophilum]|uniref:Phage terminase small subunit P27 family n=1 Tax=Symbiobacterium thermophilum TaxID=2734 RepID=A0A953LDG9_SYMTR|nr:phage terminase small subunit P27 family [Symbiobacterium thermophilum]MBY6275390.1 phage terminase small subunit P27 family [Symbiobacterium thermophilum]